MNPTPHVCESLTWQETLLISDKIVLSRYLSQSRHIYEVVFCIESGDWIKAGNYTDSAEQQPCGNGGIIVYCYERVNLAKPGNVGGRS